MYMFKYIFALHSSYVLWYILHISFMFQFVKKLSIIKSFIAIIVGDFISVLLKVDILSVNLIDIKTPI